MPRYAVPWILPVRREGVIWKNSEITVSPGESGEAASIHPLQPPLQHTLGPTQHQADRGFENRKHKED